MLLFPFYWMAITAVKPNDELTDYKNFSPFWVVDPTLEHIRYLLFETSYPRLALEHDPDLGRRRPSCRSSPRCFAAYAIERLRFTGAR